MTDDRRLRTGDRRDGASLHTPGGMGEPAAATGLSADGADLASTDMSAQPSSRDNDTQPVFGEGSSGLPMERQEEAVRRLEEQLDAAREQHLRLAAEFDNYRKRIARERTELGDRAQAALVTRLLDVLDDMDRLASDGGAAPPDSIRQAIDLVDRKLRKELEAAGLERIDPVGQPFDPSIHEAVSAVPPPTEAQDHHVSATFQTGYRYKGTLVRPARVQVFAGHGQG
ncbi:MAG TPA: nucleotide exchange factor GrpE [Gemmatimonadales bacterium]|nr:nucleotide exchange factor GrpE [Gemmatimonadales bacterium]